MIPPRCPWCERPMEDCGLVGLVQIRETGDAVIMRAEPVVIDGDARMFWCRPCGTTRITDP